MDKNSRFYVEKHEVHILCFFFSLLAYFALHFISQRILSLKSVRMAQKIFFHKNQNSGLTMRDMQKLSLYPPQTFVWTFKISEGLVWGHLGNSVQVQKKITFFAALGVAKKAFLKGIPLRNGIGGTEKKWFFLHLYRVPNFFGKFFFPN